MLRAEDLFSKELRATTVTRAWRHLGLPTPEQSEQLRNEIEGGPKSYAEWNQQHTGEAREETREMLRQFYRPHNLELSKLLDANGVSCTKGDCDRFRWL